MDNLPFGAQLTLVGMGTVFAILAALMGLLVVLVRLDRRTKITYAGDDSSAGDVTRTGATRVGAGDYWHPATRDPALEAADLIAIEDLDAKSLAAVAVAVITHVEVRRREAAPAMRTNQPGTPPTTGRWLATGRGRQLRTTSSPRR